MGNFSAIKVIGSKVFVNIGEFRKYDKSGLTEYIAYFGNTQARQFERDFVQAMLILVLLFIIAFLILYICSRHPEMKECKDDVLESVRVDKPNIDDKNASGLAPIHVALSNGRVDIARELIERGASVNCQTTYRKNTPLHYAVNNGIPHNRDIIVINNNQTLGIDFVEYLLDKGADPNIKNFRGFGPLHIVATSSQEDFDLKMFKLLVQRGAHVDMRSNHYFTPLALALQSYNDACVEELLSWGANVNDKLVAILIMADSMLNVFHEATDATKMHCVKLKAAKLPRNNCKYDRYVDKSYKDFYQECLLEVDALKNTTIDNCITLYNFLHMYANDRCNFINNVELKNLLELPKLKEMFPNYAVIILGSYREMQARKKLMRPAVEAWYGLTKINLPEVCIENIFKYMCNADLLDLIEGHQNLSALPTSKNPFRWIMSHYVHHCV